MPWHDTSPLTTCASCPQWQRFLVLLFLSEAEGELLKADKNIADKASCSSLGMDGTAYLK